MAGAGRDEADTLQQNPGNAPIAIVAIGGGQGVLPACLALLGSLPAHTGLALILLLPLDPDQTARAADSLAGQASLPVLLAQDGAALLPDHLYIVRHEAPMLLQDGRLVGTGRAEVQPFDSLLQSLAESAGTRGIAVVLSGAGRDGLDGSAALRRRGGQVMAQAPSDAEMPELPAGTIATGQVDQVLPAPALGAALALSAARARPGFVRWPESSAALGPDWPAAGSSAPVSPAASSPGSPVDDVAAQAFQAMRAPTAVLDAQGRVERSNTGFDALFNASLDPPQRPDPAAPPHGLAEARRASPHLDAFLTAACEAASGQGAVGQGATIEECIVEIASPENGTCVLRLVASPLGQSPPRILVEAEDVTERTQLVARLEMARAVADHAERAQARALAEVSHNLRQPLQSLHMLHGLMGIKTAEPALLALIQRLDETVVAMTSMLDTLLDKERMGLARFAAGEAPMAEPVLLSTLFAEMAEEFSDTVRAVGHVWRMVPTQAVVLSEAGLLRRILRDRLLHALRSPGRGRILLGCRRLQDAVRVEIWQDGMFDPAPQAHGSSEPGWEMAGDSGQQSAVSRMAALLGHPVGLRRSPDGATCFTIEVPLASKLRSDIPPAPILVIGGDADMAGSLASLLRQDGHDVLLARDGGSAMAMAAEIAPALVIVDGDLPGSMGGAELALHLRQIATAPPPTIILSSDRSAASPHHIRLLDVEHASKPIDPHELLEKVRRLLPDADTTGVAVSQVSVSVSAEGAQPLGQVFIVDDDASLRRDVAEWLTAQGWQAESFASAADFLERDNAGRQGCVLVDAMMPGIDGFAVLEALQDHAARLPAIMVTGHGDVRMAVRAMAAGALDFIEKPIRRSDLLRSICNGHARIANAASEAAVRAEVTTRLARLTARQREILDRVIAGSSSKTIAAELKLNQRTVENHRAAIMAKLNARSLPELIRKVVSAGGGPGAEA